MTFPCMANANPPSLLPGHEDQERQLSLPKKRPDTQEQPTLLMPLHALSSPETWCSGSSWPSCLALLLPGKHTSSGVPEVRVKENPSIGISCLYYL